VVQRSGGRGGTLLFPKTLVAYFSHSGSTRKLAETVAMLSSGELASLEPSVPYPSEEDSHVRALEEEERLGSLPWLNPVYPVPGGYKVVLVGSPVWRSGLAGPVRSWLSKFDFAGMAAALFVTHDGRGGYRCLDDLTRHARNASVEQDILHVRCDGRGGLIGLDEARVRTWLRAVKDPATGQPCYRGV
jgi:flavodoxin